MKDVQLQEAKKGAHSISPWIIGGKKVDSNHKKSHAAKVPSSHKVTFLMVSGAL